MHSIIIFTNVKINFTLIITDQIIKNMKLFDPSQSNALVQFEPSRSQETRMHILDSAFKLIAREGVQALTLSELARHSRLSKPRIAYHYSDMDQLVADIYETVIRRGREASGLRIAEARTPHQKIMALVEAFFGWISSNSDLCRFQLAMYGYATVSRKVGAIHRRLIQVGLERVETILSETGLSAEKRSSLAAAIYNQLIGASVREISSSGQISDKKLVLEVSTTVAALMAAAGIVETKAHK